jgi:hypothetical protein
MKIIAEVERVVAGPLLETGERVSAFISIERHCAHDQMMTVVDHLLRDRSTSTGLALVLRNLGDERYLPCLLKAVLGSTPATLNGTLVWALVPFACEQALDGIFGVVVASEVYEHHAMFVLLLEAHLPLSREVHTRLVARCAAELRQERSGRDRRRFLEHVDQLLYGA